MSGTNDPVAKEFGLGDEPPEPPHGVWFPARGSNTWPARCGMCRDPNSEHARRGRTSVGGGPNSPTVGVSWPDPPVRLELAQTRLGLPTQVQSEHPAIQAPRPAHRSPGGTARGPPAPGDEPHNRTDGLPDKVRIPRGAFQKVWIQKVWIRHGSDPSLPLDLSHPGRL